MAQKSPIGYADKNDLQKLLLIKKEEISYNENISQSMLQFKLQDNKIIMTLDRNWCAELDKLELYETENMIDICFKTFTYQINSLEFTDKFQSTINPEVLNILTKIGQIDQCNNITEEDIKSFISFLYNGQYAFDCNRLPVVGCLFLGFQLNVLFKHFVFAIVNLLELQQIKFNSTAQYDDLLILYLFSEYASLTPTVETDYKYFLTYLEYCLAFSDKCCFIDELKTSPLFEVFTENNFLAFQDNLLLRERIQNFGHKCKFNEMSDELMMFPMFIRNIIQVITILQLQEQQVTPYDRSRKAGYLFNQLFPMANLSETFFYNLKCLYQDYDVIEALSVKINKQEEQIEQLQAYNTCLSMIVPKN